MRAADCEFELFDPAMIGTDSRIDYYQRCWHLKIACETKGLINELEKGNIYAKRLDEGVKELTPHAGSKRNHYILSDYRDLKKESD